MADLIDRQAAIEAVQEALAKMEHSNYFHIWTTTEVRVMVVERILEQLPSAEPKTGHWIKIHWKAYRCSECNRASEYSTDYCPNCGAYMKEDTDETD